MPEYNLFEEKPSDALDLIRIGPNLLQHKYGVYLSNEIVEAANSLNRKISYDIDIRGPYTDNLNYTEFFQSVGGIHVGLANKKFEIERCKNMVQDHDNSHLNEYTEKMILERLHAKYISFPHISKKEFGCIVFLPGSNILKEVTDLSKIHTMILQHNAYIKPHPLTNLADLEFLNKEFRFRIINKKVDALDLINHTSKIAICGSSELFSYSILKNKIVYSISSDVNNTKKGGYYFVFDNIINLPHLKRKKALLNLITHKHSGIFLPFLDKNISLVDYINNVK